MRTPKFRDTHIGLAHGNGGRFMRELIEEIFAPALANPQLDTGADAVALPMPADRDLMVTTDGFTVQPLEFPGGNIGSLAVHGTVNDLAMCGALYQRQKALEEGRGSGGILVHLPVSADQRRALFHEVHSEKVMLSCFHG